MTKGYEDAIEIIFRDVPCIERDIFLPKEFENLLYEIE